MDLLAEPGGLPVKAVLMVGKDHRAEDFWRIIRDPDSVHGRNGFGDTRRRPAHAISGQDSMASNGAILKIFFILRTPVYVGEIQLLCGQGLRQSKRLPAVASIFVFMDAARDR